jgi:hypothetical protein
MIRPVVHLFAFVLALAVAPQLASAGKPTVAILGLEVIDDGSGIDAKTTQFAKELTEELRKRPKAGTGPYALAPGSDKDLLELKLLSGCENEQKDCMAAIGSDLAADRLLFGKIEKRANGYQVSLKLLNIGTKAFEKSVSDIVPFSEATGANLTSWGKRLYAKLTGVTDQGTLVIKANVERGTVYLDDQVKGNLSGGQARIAGLSEGKYKIAIEAEGHLRYEASVDVGAGGETTHNADLEKNAIHGGTGGGDGGAGGGPGPGNSEIITGTVSTDERPGGGYRAMFWASLVLTAGSAVGTTVYGLKVRGSDKQEKEDAISDWQTSTMMMLDIKDACGDAERRLGAGGAPNEDGLSLVVDKCDQGQKDALVTNVFIGATAVAAVATVFFYYKGYVASKQSREAANSTVTKGKKKRKPTGPAVTFHPGVTPTEVTAGMRITF